MLLKITSDFTKTQTEQFRTEVIETLSALSMFEVRADKLKLSVILHCYWLDMIDNAFIYYNAQGSPFRCNEMQPAINRSPEPYSYIRYIKYTSKYDTTYTMI